MSEPGANPYALPQGLPVPEDDGACDHLAGLRLPDIGLLSTSGVRWNLRGAGRCILYAYPASGVPGVDPLPDWDAIPGAPGCTLQALGFAACHGRLQALGYRVFAVSAQALAEQREFALRLRLPLVLLNDSAFVLRDRLGLPTFQAGGRQFYRRLVLVIEDGTIRRVFYPVFPPDRSAAEVLAWLERNP